MLSRNWTARSLVREALRDIEGFEISNLPLFEWIFMVNRAVNDVIGLFYGILAEDYMTPVIFVSDDAGRYSTATGTWTASTKVFDIALSSSLVLTDIGKMITFRIGANTYAGVLTGFTSTTSGTISGINLPASNGTIDWLMVIPTPPDSDEISIAYLPMMRMGQQVRFTLESSALTYKNCTPASVEDLNNFRVGSALNASTILFTIQGEKILLRKPTALASYGTLTGRYPRIPTPVTSLDDYVDVADTSPISAVVVRLKRIIADRIKREVKIDVNEITSIVQAVYASAGITAADEEIKQKVDALK